VHILVRNKYLLFNIHGMNIKLMTACVQIEIRRRDLPITK